MKPIGIADSLIDFIEYDFTSLWVVIDALYELPIFGEYMDFTAGDFESTLDVRVADLVDCQEYCRDIAGISRCLRDFYRQISPSSAERNSWRD